MSIETINELLGRMGIQVPIRRQNRLLWFNAPKDWKGTVYLFGWTPHRTRDAETGQEGFFAVKYRQLKNGTCKLVKSVRFGRRKIAKARAIKWYNQYYRKEKKVDG